MPDVRIPPELVEATRGDECVRWIMDHCAHGVQGRVDPAVGFVLYFDAGEEAEAFRSKWLDR